MLTDNVSNATLVKTEQRGVDSRVDYILDNPTSPEALLYKQASLARRSAVRKNYLEAALMCETDLEKISEVIEMPVDVIETYRHFYFNTLEWDRLDKVAHIESCTDSAESTLKLWAITHGLTFLAWRLGKKVSISPTDGLEELFSMSLYKAKEVVFNGPNSTSSKEAPKWVKLSTDIARLLKLWVMDSNEAKRDLLVALESVSDDFTSINELMSADELAAALPSLTVEIKEDGEPSGD